MSSLIEQMKQYVERTEAAERSVSETRASVTQVAQLAYTLNCIWLYSQSTPPSREVLMRAMPPAVTEDPNSITQGLEYVRKTMIVVRSLVSEKVEKLSQQQADLDSLSAILGSAMVSVPDVPRIEPFSEAEVEDVVDAFVPLAINPTKKSSKRDEKAVQARAQKRPWIFT